MTEFLFTLDRIRVVLPSGKPLFEDVRLSFLEGAKIGIVGANGSGKSTLLKIIAGENKDFMGDVHRREGLTIGYLEQEPEFDHQRTVFDIVNEGFGEKKDVLDKFNAISEQLGTVEDPDDMMRMIDEQADLQAIIDAEGLWDIESRGEMAMNALCCPDGNALFGEISGGERRRVALCRLLLMQPNVLLLDEPTNHLDAQTVAWLEHHLKNYAGAVIMITHDRSFLDSITEWILELDKGQAMPFKGNYRQWLGRKIQDAEKSGKMNSLFHEIAAENDWIKIKSRNKASTEKATAAGKALRIVIRESAKLGRDVVSVKGVTYAREDRVLFDNIDLDLVPGGVFGVIGPNGAGKTTLLELLSGGLQQANGKITRGQTVEMLYAKQLDHYLDPKQNVYEAISDGMETVQGSGGATIQMRAYVAAFNFPSTAQSKRVSSLSGGERNRVYLARTLKMGCNVLLLDEPTNDLDVESIRALEEAILAFNGTVVVVSHDRWFLNRIATAILSCEGDGSIVKIDGNFDSYLEDRQRRLGDKALIPHKARYRKLVR